MNIKDKFFPGHEITAESRLSPWLPELKKRYNGDTVTLLNCNICSSNFDNHEYLIDTPEGFAICYHEVEGCYFGAPSTPMIDFDLTF